MLRQGGLPSDYNDLTSTVLTSTSASASKTGHAMLKQQNRRLRKRLRKAWIKAGDAMDIDDAVPEISVDKPTSHEHALGKKKKRKRKRKTGCPDLETLGKGVQRESRSIHSQCGILTIKSIF